MLWALLLACSHPEGGGKGPDAPETIDEPTQPEPPDTGITDTSAPPEAGFVNGYTGPSRLLASVNNSEILVYNPEDGVIIPVAGLTLGPEVRLSCAGESLWVLVSQLAEGASDLVYRVDPSTGAVVDTWDMGSFYRPTDVRQIGDVWGISSWGKDRLATATDAGLTGAYVSLQGLDEGDGSVEASGLWGVGDYTYLTLVGVDLAGTYSGSRLVEFTNVGVTLGRTLDLVGHAASGRMVAANGVLYIHHNSTVGTTGAQADGGIEAVDLASWTSLGMVVDDAIDSRVDLTTFFDPRGTVAWRAFSQAGNQAGMWYLADGSTAQSFPLSGGVGGIGALGGQRLWIAENAFDGSSNAIVERSPFDGSEVSRIATDGPVRSLLVCESGD